MLQEVSNVNIKCKKPKRTKTVQKLNTINAYKSSKRQAKS